MNEYAESEMGVALRPVVEVAAGSALRDLHDKLGGYWCHGAGRRSKRPHTSN